MKKRTNWQKEFNKEISQSEMARAIGNEGKARVCARRAASAVIAEYLERRGLPDPGVSVIDRLQSLENLPDLSAETKRTIQYLLMRVTPEHNLPIEVDLIAEARRLEQELLEN
jgi:hypothetical protein